MWLSWHMAYAGHLEEASIHLSPSSHPGAWSSVFGPLQDLLFGARHTSRAAGNVQPLRTTTEGSQLSSSSGTDKWVALSFLAIKHYYCTGTKGVEAFLSRLSSCQPFGQERDLGPAREP